MHQGGVQDQEGCGLQDAVQGCSSCIAGQGLAVVQQGHELRHHLRPHLARQALQAALQLGCAGLGLSPACRAALTQPPDLPGGAR